uniref:Uncharacterized protein n=1 Tax=Octactis speculum TaxID=3111310 RepID=A0A7S2GFG9_9STRA
MLVIDLMAKGGKKGGPIGRTSRSIKKTTRISDNKYRDSLEGLSRRRVAAQKKRLTRALQRAGDNKVASLAVHLDGCHSYAESAAAGDEMAQKERLTHLRHVYTLKLSDTCSPPTMDDTKAQCIDHEDLRSDHVLALLDAGEASEARLALQVWTRGDRRPSGGFNAACHAWSQALIEFVAWSGGEEKTREVADSALDCALETNVYIGVFIANASIFVEEIDSAEAADVCAIPRSTIGYVGSVEEALTYATVAMGCWLDFLEKGVEDWVAERLASRDEGKVEWPPRSCVGDSLSKFQSMFVQAYEVAEAAEDEDDEDDDEDAEDAEGLSTIDEEDGSDSSQVAS